MGNYLWKVTAKRSINLLPQGANVEIATTSKSSKPTPRQMSEAFEEKYGEIRVSIGHYSSPSSFECELLG